MRIKRVRIENFRCLEEAAIEFDDVTTFVGPNGAGKSTVLRALEWFFNGTKSSLTADDVYMNDETRTVLVEVEFDRITESDRAQLGKYAAPGQTVVTISRQWFNGVDKTIGRARTFPPFEEVRGGANATERGRRYKALLEAQPDLGLQKWSNDAAMADYMSAWETEHPDQLEMADAESSSHFFGIASQSRMTGLFDFIFVSADLRAAEEATDSRGAVIGRILEHAVDRTAANEELAALMALTSQGQREIHGKHFDEQLELLSDDLTEAVEQFTTGRAIQIASEIADLQPQRPSFTVSVLDQSLETRVDRQGHGFQRALLIAALKVLAERGRAEGDEGVLCLAIEEPELYQHPLQARTFAAVLRSLAEGEDEGVQVCYATHSPYFIEAKSFHQIRRVARTGRREAGFPRRTQIIGSSVEKVVARLDGFIGDEQVRRQLDSVCMGQFGEAFFADSVLLVEGSTDRAVLSGVAARDSIPLLLDGVFIGESGGKTGLLLPHVILDELGIRTYLVADNDSHLEAKLAVAVENGDLPRQRKLRDSLRDAKDWNRKILRFFGHDEQDWPVGSQSRNLLFVDGGLEEALDRMWPAWRETCESLIDEGVGFSGKDRATYEEAALHADGDIPDFLTAVLQGVRDLRDAA